MIDAQQLQDTIHAAKAAGLPPIVHMEGIGTGYWPERGDFVMWPYEAAQLIGLAGVLKMTVAFGEDSVSAHAQSTFVTAKYLNYGGNRVWAAQDAIFRVAVAIGKAMP